jgi:hypothetical protein
MTPLGGYFVSQSARNKRRATVKANLRLDRHLQRIRNQEIELRTDGQASFTEN